MNDFKKTIIESVAHFIKQHPELATPIMMMADNLRQQEIKKVKQGSNALEYKFTKIYKGNGWGSIESYSGTGSEYSYTENLRKHLPELLSHFNVKKLLDAPCGDFNWMKYVVESTEIDYVGADIVADLVEENNNLYQSERVVFIQLDITKDSLPAADLMICRDCLFHLSNENIRRFLNNFVSSDIPYLLATTHTNNTGFSNTNIEDGGFRALDLLSEPFYLSDNYFAVIDDWIPGYEERKLCLWSRDQVAEALVKCNSVVF